MGNYGKLWETMGNYGKLWETMEGPWNESTSEVHTGLAWGCPDVVVFAILGNAKHSQYFNFGCSEKSRTKTRAFSLHLQVDHQRVGEPLRAQAWENVGFPEGQDFGAANRSRKSAECPGQEHLQSKHIVYISP